jgi:hypothetical protein
LPPNVVELRKGTELDDAGDVGCEMVHLAPPGGEGEPCGDACGETAVL